MYARLGEHGVVLNLGLLRVRAVAADDHQLGCAPPQVTSQRCKGYLTAVAHRLQACWAPTNPTNTSHILTSQLAQEWKLEAISRPEVCI